jgi:hypothetical protein
MRYFLLALLLCACGAPDSRTDCGADGGWEWGSVVELDGGTRVIGCP